MSEAQAAAEVADVVELPSKDDFIEGAGEEKSPDVAAEPEYSEIEQKAHDMGWRPHEEWDGDEDTWVDAKEFVGRQPLYEGLSKQSKKIKTMETMLKTLAEQNKLIQENAKKEALEELKQQRIKALQEEDYEQAVKLEDEARKVEAAEEAPAEDGKQGETAKFKEWREENAWFDDDLDLRIYANGYGQQLYAASPELSEEDLYARVSAKVKEVFPEKFGGKKKLPNRGNPTGGQGSGRARGGNSKFARLTPEQKKMCKEFVSQGLFTEESYIKMLEEAGTLEEA